MRTGWPEFVAAVPDVLRVFAFVGLVVLWAAIGAVVGFALGGGTVFLVYRLLVTPIPPPNEAHETFGDAMLALCLMFSVGSLFTPIGMAAGSAFGGWVADRWVTGSSTLNIPMSFSRMASDS